MVAGMLTAINLLSSACLIAAGLFGEPHRRPCRPPRPQQGIGSRSR
jgi:hypothetical protein